MGSAFAESIPMLEHLLTQLPSMRDLQPFLTSLPASDGMALITDRDTCIFCEGVLKTSDSSLFAPLYSAHGVKTVRLYSALKRRNLCQMCVCIDVFLRGVRAVTCVKTCKTELEKR